MQSTVIWYLPILMRLPVVSFLFLNHNYFQCRVASCPQKVPTASSYADRLLSSSLRLCLCKLSQHVDHDAVWLTIVYYMFVLDMGMSEEAHSPPSFPSDTTNDEKQRGTTVDGKHRP